MIRDGRDGRDRESSREVYHRRPRAGPTPRLSGGSGNFLLPWYLDRTIGASKISMTVQPALVYLLSFVRCFSRS